jgi:hypothetical protein
MTTRNLYLGTLALLQAAMMWQVLPAVVGLLQRQIPLGGAADFWTSTIQLGAALTCIVASAVVLAFPTIALLRHFEHGPHRFVLLPPWACNTAITGAAMLVAALLPRMLGDPGGTDAARSTAMPLALTGFSVMHAGALAAELLRRNPYVRRSEAAPDLDPDPIARSKVAAWHRAT